MLKTADDVNTVYQYDFNGNIIAENEVSESHSRNPLIAEYIYMGVNRLAKADYSRETIYYYLNNHLGTPLLMTDKDGKVVWEAYYEPFGEAEVDSYSTITNNFRFPGQYYDEETGLHYNYFRYYDPKTGRYLTPDPIGFLGGELNLFSYVNNNPINLIDPLGLEFSDILPGIKKAITEGTIGGAYAVGEATKATADIAMHGHPLAQTALGVAFVSEAAPLTAAAVITVTPSAVSAAYVAAPYSGAIVDLIYGVIPETGPPKGIGGYVGSFSRFIAEQVRNAIVQTGLKQDNELCE